MFDFRKANCASPVTSRHPTRSSSMGPSMASCHSQASGLAYVRALKANLQRSASQILAPPDSSAASSPQGNNTLNSQPQTEAERRADTAMADEKDKIAAADELQHYLEEGILDEEEYKDFSLTRYWQVSDGFVIHYFESLMHKH